MSTNSTGDELMNAKLNAGIIEVSDVVETEQSASIPVATVLDVSSAEPMETETKSLETKQDDDDEEEVSKEGNEEKEEEKGGLNMLADVTCFKMKQIFKLKEHYSDWKLENTFHVFDSDTGEKLYKAEESTSRCSKLCCFGRKTMIRMNDLKRETEVSKAHPDLLYMKRPYSLSLLGLFRPKLHVYAVPSKKERAKTSAGEYGVMIGTVVCPFMLSNVGVDIYSKTGEYAYQIRGNRCQAAMMCSYISAPCQMFKRAYFTIHKVVNGGVQEHPCGGITKFLRASRNKNRWKFIKDQNIPANTIYIDIGSANYSPMFHQEDNESDNDNKKKIRIEHKALIIASVFLLDAMCFHHTRENPRGKVVRPIGHIKHDMTWSKARTEAAIASASSTTT